jgi:hypothetical protein
MTRCNVIARERSRQTRSNLRADHDATLSLRADDPDGGEAISVLAVSRALPSILLLAVMAAAALAGCRGKHTPPPGFVPPADLEGYALLMVRLEDGAWAQQSPMAAIEKLHPVEGLPWLLVRASQKEGAEALLLVESLGFELECKGDDPCGLDQSQERPAARINAVRLARIMRDVFSEKKSILGDSGDNRFVNLIGSGEEAGRSEDSGLCHALFPSRVDCQWLVGWIPCESPEYVMVLHGPEALAKALKIVDFLEL